MGIRCAFCILSIILSAQWFRSIECCFSGQKNKLKNLGTKTLCVRFKFDQADAFVHLCYFEIEWLLSNTEPFDGNGVRFKIKIKIILKSDFKIIILIEQHWPNFILLET